MKIALIITEISKARKSHLLALELDERLSEQGNYTKIFDLADKSYNLEDLERFDSFLLIGTNVGPLYSNETHQILTRYKHLWRNKRIGSVMVSNEKMLGDAADIQLKLVLKSLGAKLVPDQLVVVETQSKFDRSLNLVDEALNLKISEYLYLFAYGTRAFDQKRLIA